jgi:hypothetical protein
MTTTTTTATTNTPRAFNASSFNASSSRDRQRRERQRRGETTKSRTVKAVPAWHPENKNDVPFDEPTPGFSSIPSALEEIKKGKFVVVLDDEDRENEGDLIGRGRFDDARKHGVYDSTHEWVSVRFVGR